MKKVLFIVLALFTLTTFAQTATTKKDTAAIVVDTNHSLAQTPVATKVADTIQVVESAWDKFLANILGTDLDWVGYLSCFVFAFIGLFLRWYWKAKKGIKNNPTSPIKFSWQYWFSDNLLPKLVSVMATFLIIFIALRFSMELIGMIPSMFLSLTIGLCFDWIADKIKNIKPPITPTNSANPTT